MTIILFFFSHVAKNNTCIEVYEFWYIYCHIWILIIDSYWNFPSMFMLSFPQIPRLPLSLSPTNVRHFLTSPVVNLPTSYPRATKKKHQNVRNFPSEIDVIQTNLASIASLCTLEMFVGCSQTFCKEIGFFKMHFNSEVLLQDTNVAYWLSHFP